MSAPDRDRILAPGRPWSLWELMYRLRAAAFLKAYEQASTFCQFLVSEEGKDLTYIIVEDHMKFIGQLEDLEKELVSLGMNGARLCVSRALGVLRSAKIGGGTSQGHLCIVLASIDAAKIKTWLSQATSRISDDFSAQCVLVLSSELQLFYDQPELFGPDVFKKFASANEDIAEAGTCLALGRGTACVLHLMRVVEVGLAALAKAVGVSKQNDWGSYLREIDRELNKRIKSSGARSADEQFYAETATTVDNMRRAWRNPTMHPEKTYSTDRAREILLSVRSFMGHIATKLSE